MNPDLYRRYCLIRPLQK